MWEEDTNDQINDLNVNKKFAQKFTQRKKREDIEKAKVKYGKDLNSKFTLIKISYIEKEVLGDDDDYSDESSSAPEDEDAELLTDNVERNFIKTLAKIRAGAPEIYKKDKAFFDGKFLCIIFIHLFL